MHSSTCNGCQQLHDLFSQLKGTSFSCTKTLGPDESDDKWITQVCTIVKDCEFDKTDNDEFIKLVVTLHTTSEEAANHHHSKGQRSHQSHCSSKINGNGTTGSQVYEEQYTATVDT